MRDSSPRGPGAYRLIAGPGCSEQLINEIRDALPAAPVVDKLEDPGHGGD
jgi:hypothetical protein